MFIVRENFVQIVEISYKEHRGMSALKQNRYLWKKQI